MIDSSYFVSIDTAAQVRQRRASNSSADEASRAQAALELQELAFLRPIAGMLGALGQGGTPEFGSQWPDEQKRMAEQALLMMSRGARWTGSRGVAGLLSEPAGADTPLWRLALKNQAQLRADGVDLAMISVMRSAPSIIRAELALMGAASVEKTPEARAIEAQSMLIEEMPVAKNAWAAACVEAGMPAALARVFSDFNDEALCVHALSMVSQARGPKGRGLRLGMIDEGGREGEDEASPRDKEDAPAQRAKARTQRLARAAAQQPREQTARAAMELLDGPQRLFLAAAQRSDWTRSSSDQAKHSRLVGAVFEAVHKALRGQLSPSVATACAASLWENAPLAANAISLCRKAGASLTTASGAPTPWGIAFVERMERLGCLLEGATAKAWREGLGAAIRHGVEWAREDNLATPSDASWEQFFARRALEKIAAEGIGGRRSPNWDDNDGIAPAIGRVRLCEELLAARGQACARGADKPGAEPAGAAIDASASARLSIDFLEARVEWSDDAAKEKAGPKGFPGEGDNGSVESKKAVWERLAACVSELEAQAGQKSAPRKKPLSL